MDERRRGELEQLADRVAALYLVAVHAGLSDREIDWLDHGCPAVEQLTREGRF